eukprot:s1531_g3.t2
MTAGPTAMQVTTHLASRQCKQRQPHMLWLQGFKVVRCTPGHVDSRFTLFGGTQTLLIPSIKAVGCFSLLQYNAPVFFRTFPHAIASSCGQCRRYNGANNLEKRSSNVVREPMPMN